MIESDVVNILSTQSNLSKTISRCFSIVAKYSINNLSFDLETAKMICKEYDDEKRNKKANLRSNAPDVWNDFVENLMIGEINKR